MVVKKEPLRPKNDFKIPITVPLHVSTYCISKY